MNGINDEDVNARDEGGDGGGCGSGGGIFVDSPLIIDVVNHHAADDTHSIDSEKARMISEEIGDESRVMKHILNDYQGRFSIFRDGILKLKHYYDTQMILIKSHFHKTNSDESYQTSPSSKDFFIGKIVQIMELALKQILSLMDASDMTRSFADETIDVLDQDVEGDIEVTEPKITKKFSVDEESRQGSSTQLFPPMISAEANTQQVTCQQHSIGFPNASCSILSPQFDIPYDTGQEDNTNQQTVEPQSQAASNSEVVPPRLPSNSEVIPPLQIGTNSASTSQQHHFDSKNPKSNDVADSNRYNPIILQDGRNNSIATANNDYLETNMADFGLLPPGTGEQFVCPYCKFTFTTKRDMNRHLRSHTGEKPFHCEVCSKYFARKDFLTKHKLTHTGEKPYSCEQCNKRFSQRSNLNKHLLTHTKEHKHICKICQRGFHQMINLHRHEQIHCNVSKQFQCVWCTKMAYQGPDCFKTFLDKREAANG
ncbi:uncharacterized protein [Clytia hemisphaerica]|uniref:C2H2-type domain-containing protein n=1 Tax=Clytia hemisphaerica TaxID=252671 RepID=A0A7M5X5Q5_9CNID